MKNEIKGKTSNDTQSVYKKRSYTEAEASDYVGQAESTLRQGRCHGKRKNRTPVPRHIKIGRSVRYLKEDLDAFLDEMRKQSIAA